ncbi:MAG TPA: glycoside hydrolase family 3 C-terminal domain-containing protein [Streptosporangiaceae bacterium]|nr:glycoside hydrolase family 3 C-terminal domain-containing protein [Streptosporangiaceae bacterium]
MALDPPRKLNSHIKISRHIKNRRTSIALAAALVLAASLLSPGAAAARAAFPFQDPNLPVATRVNDLLQRLTLDEKISLLHQYQPAIPRLGVKAFKTGTEALHGYAWTSDASGNQIHAKGTVFPQAVGLASTWDPALIKQVGRAVGTEARGYHSTNDERQLWGLNVWAPVVNLLRDPRWGRNEEGYSEDTTLTGAISTAYGQGMVGNTPGHLLTAPTLKHYLANNNEVSRATSDVQLRERVLNEYDRQAFRPAISADAATGVMSAYNPVNGRPNAVNPDLGTLVRSWTDKDLFHVTDAGLPDSLAGPGTDPNWNTHYYANFTEGDAAILKSGTDSFTVDNGNGTNTVTAVNDALAKGLLTTTDIDTAVRHILSIRVRLGEFDPGGGPYGAIDASVINSPAHQRLNRQTAGAAQVLLKNSADKDGTATLPLDAAKTKRIAVVGPLQNTLYTDWYSGNLPYQVTPLDGIKERLGADAAVTASEGVDRIALKDVQTGKYVTAGTVEGGAVIRESATTADATAQFDAFDWGQGVLTLRSVANGKYVGYNFANFVNDQVQPSGWFVQQQFKLEQRPNGNYVIRYAGYETRESWFTRDHYLTLRPDGTLNLGASTPEAATEFAKETITSGVDSAVAAAKGADAAVVVVGSMPFINGREAHDRTTMALAEGQENLLKAVHAANPNTIMVLENSYPTTINWAQRNVPAILWTTHAGAETGHALADVLFGDVNPAGRLTQTWYRSDADLPGILDYDIIKSDRTYLYYKGTPLYPFGHGLSYTTFRYAGLRTSAASVGTNGTVTVSVEVTNTGRVAGDEVVQLYTRQRASRDKQPLRQLRAFQRVNLKPGQTKTARLTLRAADLAHWDVTRGRWVVESTDHDLMVGASAADIRQRGTLRVRGETIPARDLSKPTPAVDFDDYSGIRLVDESKASGTAVGASGSGGSGSSGQWVKFADSILGAKTFTARAAKASAGDGSIQIRLGSPTGRLVGTATVATTGDKYAYATTTAALSGATGRHDVYLVFSGDIRISTFSIK